MDNIITPIQFKDDKIYFDKDFIGEIIRYNNKGYLINRDRNVPDFIWELVGMEWFLINPGVTDLNFGLQIQTKELDNILDDLNIPL